MAFASCQGQRVHGSRMVTGQRAVVLARVAKAPKSRMVLAQASSAHSAKIIDGKKIAEDIRGEIAAEVRALKATTGKVSVHHALSLYHYTAPQAYFPCCCTPGHQVPGLAVVLVGSRKDSETYVRSKKKSSAEVGHTTLLWLSAVIAA